MDAKIINGKLTALGNVNDALLLRQSRINIEAILKQVLQDNSVGLALSYRNIGLSRLSIAKDDKIVIPSLDNLSTGQSILFNLFATIVRYAEQGDINKSINLPSIEGIVLIDEIDAHLHSDLQYDVLPSLIRLFPKVQFIVTTHAPLFLLGMEKVFGSNGFQIVEVPSGISITTERFSEFQHSFEYYKQTMMYEGELKRRLQANQKPLVLTEGETDPIYIKTALEVLGQNDLLQSADIEWVGGYANGGPFNTGDTGLTHTRNVVTANPSLFNRKLLLLYDCDTNKPSESAGLLSVRSIPRNDANTKVKSGIENLLPADIFEDRFYTDKTTTGNYGQRTVVSEFRKTDFCRYVCKERRNPADFQRFSIVVDILKEFLGIQQPQNIV